MGVFTAIKKRECKRGLTLTGIFSESHQATRQARPAEAQSGYGHGVLHAWLSWWPREILKRFRGLGTRTKLKRKLLYFQILLVSTFCVLGKEFK